MNINQTCGSLTPRRRGRAKSKAKARQPNSDHPEAKLQEHLDSLSQRFYELGLIVDQFSEGVTSSGQTDAPGNDWPKPSPQAAFESDLAEPVLTYRLCSLLDFLRDLYGFGNAGVFAWEKENGSLNTLASSPKPGQEESGAEFAGQIEAMWKSGSLDSVVRHSKREVLSVQRATKLVVMPFKFAEAGEGFWITQFDGDMVPGKKSFADMVLWTELISACVQNSYLTSPSSSPRVDEPYHVDGERLYTTAQLCRALTHEINNPLQVILGRTQLLKMNQRRSNGPRAEGKILEALETNANKICSLLKDFCDHLHRQSGQIPERGEVNLLHIVRSDLRLLRYLLGSDKIGLEATLDGNLPSVQGNPGDLEQAFLSLTWELRDRLPLGGSLRLEAFQHAGFVCLDLHCSGKDDLTGGGPNSQEFNSSGRIRMVSDILHRFGGSLEFEETSAAGTRLRLTFPIAQATEREPAAIQESSG